MSPGDAFPGDAPRPVAPVLILRSFDIPQTRATHLRLVVKTNQCTGGPQFQGEQDADPFNATDCDTAGPASTRFVRIAEFQAFDESSRIVSRGGGSGSDSGSASGSAGGSSGEPSATGSNPATPATPLSPGQVAGVRAAFCVVPKLNGRPTVGARRALARAGCTVGRVLARRSLAKKGVVLSQAPRAGRRVRAGTKISFVVSRGR